LPSSGALIRMRAADFRMRSSQSAFRQPRADEIAQKVVNVNGSPPLARFHFSCFQACIALPCVCTGNHSVACDYAPLKQAGEAKARRSTCQFCGNVVESWTELWMREEKTGNE